MSNIIWKGPEREIPGYCLAKTGEPLPDTVPEDMVRSYIGQGLAERKSVKVSNKKED